MEKQEILEKSRKENQLHDEGVLHAQEKGRKWGVVGFLSLLIAVQIYQLVQGLDNYLPMSLLWAYLAAQALGKYQVRRERKFLWVVVCGAIASLCFLLCYVLRTW